MKNVEINGPPRFEIPGRDCFPGKNFLGVVYNTIRIWDFEEWGYMSGVFIMKVVGKVG